MTDKILKATCRYCGKEMSSLYEKQLLNSIGVHELTCPMKKGESKEDDDET